MSGDHRPTVLCERLHVHTRENAQELVNRYANRELQHDFGLEKTLDTLFPLEWHQSKSSADHPSPLPTN